MSARSRTVMAFDYGARRIGVAIGETLAATAGPLATLPVRADGPDWRALATLVATWAPDLFVVGLPTHADGTPHRLAPAIAAFAAGLTARHGRPVETVDERLSSVEASARAGRGGQARVDALAAQVILETWFGTRSARADSPA